MDKQDIATYSDTQQKIMDATLHLVAENGFKATTTREIARISGVNESTVFKNFANKRKIFIEAFSQKLALLMNEMQVVEETTEELAIYLERTGERMYRTLVKNSDIITITLREIGNADLQLDKNTVLEQLVNLIVTQLVERSDYTVEVLTTPVFMFVTSLMFKVIDDSHGYRLTDDLQADIEVATIVTQTIKMIV